MNENAQFYRRKINLNKKFINNLQANLEYLSMKFRIPSRPLIFWDKCLILKIIKEILDQKMNF